MANQALAVSEAQALTVQEQQLKAKMAILTQRTPADEVKVRSGRGGTKFRYVEHAYVTEVLNNAFAWNWDFEVLSEAIYDTEVVVRGRLTIRPSEGVAIVKEQYGGADIERYSSGPKSGTPLSIADNLKAASSDALKKCASLLGIALDLYGRDYPEPQENTPQQAPQTQRRSMANKEQLMLIGELAYATNTDPDSILTAYKVEDFTDLTENQAGKIILRLQRDKAKTTVPQVQVTELQGAGVEP